MNATTHLDEAERRRRRLFARTEAWLYAVPDWIAELEAEPGLRIVGDLADLPINCRCHRVSRPVETQGVERAELARRLQIILALWRTLTPTEQRFVQLRYWTEQPEAGLSHRAIARELRVHRNTVGNMRQRVVEEFRLALFGE